MTHNMHEGCRATRGSFSNSGCYCGGTPFSSGLDDGKGRPVDQRNSNLNHAFVLGHHHFALVAPGLFGIQVFWPQKAVLPALMSLPKSELIT